MTADKIYYAYISKGNHLVVVPWKGETDRQERQRGLKLEIGIFSARSDVDARTIAKKLEGTS